MLVPDLNAGLAAAAAGYYRLILLVGAPESGKTRTLREHAQAAGFPFVQIGSPAAARLLEVNPRQRKQRASEIIADLVAELTGDVVAIDDIEFLFEPSLALDPLRLLQGLARNRTIIAVWPGAFVGETLTYADATHPEHRVYRNPDAIVVAEAASPRRTSDGALPSETSAHDAL